MGFVIRWLRKLRRKYLPSEFMGVCYLRAAYKQLLNNVGSIYRKGVPVNIGGCGYFRIESSIVFGKYNYEEWGNNSNNGFKKWLETCKGKTTVFDVGAHIGLYSLPVSSHLYPRGCVYAFEPSDKNCAIFQKHLRYNNINNIQLFSCLVGEHEEQNVPFFERLDDIDDMNSIVVKKNFHLYTKTFKQQITIDHFCIERALSPEVIKIDVEGAELRVLKGAKIIITRYHPVIILSVHLEQLKLLGESIEELKNTITNFGYRIYDDKGKPVQNFALQEYLLLPS